jgi:Terpene cyclase DEP1
MVAIVVHAVLGVLVIAWVVRLNPLVRRRPPAGPAYTPLELGYLVVGLASWVLGYAFNIQFVREYGVPGGNPLWGDGSWQEFIIRLFDNPAAASASQDYIFINVVVLPLFTIIDGRRRGLPKPWLFFVATLFTSCAFGLCLYLFVAERLRRHGAWREVPVGLAPEVVGGPKRT